MIATPELSCAPRASELTPCRAPIDHRYRLLRSLCALIGVPYFRPRVEYACALPSAPFIVACRHTTLLDWAAIAHFIPRPVRFLVTRDYYDHPLFRWFCRWGGAIPVCPGRIEPSAIRAALSALEKGEVVGIFPEGRITRDGGQLPFQRGAVELAIRSGCPIVPATIRGAFRAFPRHRRVPRPRRVVVAFGAPLDCASLVMGHAALSEAERRDRSDILTRELAARVTRLSNDRHT
jgi:1-acyl-sn-glycerol-3-phosphate acyltransferase